MEVTRNLDMRAQMAGSTTAHKFQTFDFVGMYPNIPVVPLKQKMKEALKLAYEHQEKHHGFKSLKLQWSFKKDEVTPVIRNVQWSKENPRSIDDDVEGEYFVGYDRVGAWIDFILDEGYVQFGDSMYKQSSGIFMGTSPAPELAIFSLLCMSSISWVR